MGIAAAIISGVIGTAAAVTSAVGASQSAKAEEEALEKQNKMSVEEAEKDRDLKRRQQNMESFQLLAQQRQDAEQQATRKSFNQAALKGMRTAMQKRQGGGAPQGRAMPQSPMQVPAPSPMVAPRTTPPPAIGVAGGPQPAVPRRNAMGGM